MLATPLPNERVEPVPKLGDLLGPRARQLVQLSALFQSERLPLGQVDLDRGPVKLVTHHTRDECQIGCVHASPLPQ